MSLALRWLKAVSSTFQDVDFDVSFLPLVKQAKSSVYWTIMNGSNGLSLEIFLSTERTDKDALEVNIKENMTASSK